jgi:gas vesicle protein
MKTSYLFYAALGAAAVLLLTSEKGKEVREDVMDKTGDWTKRLGKILSSARNEVSDLKTIVSNEIEGLSDDARERIMTILDESEASGKRMKKTTSKQLS